MVLLKLCSLCPVIWCSSSIERENTITIPCGGAGCHYACGLFVLQGAALAVAAQLCGLQSPARQGPTPSLQGPGTAAGCTWWQQEQHGSEAAGLPVTAGILVPTVWCVWSSQSAQLAALCDCVTCHGWPHCSHVLVLWAMTNVSITCWYQQTGMLMHLQPPCTAQLNRMEA